MGYGGGRFLPVESLCLFEVKKSNDDIKALNLPVVLYNLGTYPSSPSTAGDRQSIRTWAISFEGVKGLVAFSY
jgi:hypothetical protein